MQNEIHNRAHDFLRSEAKFHAAPCNQLSINLQQTSDSNRELQRSVHAALSSSVKVAVHCRRLGRYGPDVMTVL